MRRLEPVPETIYAVVRADGTISDFGTDRANAEAWMKKCQTLTDFQDLMPYRLVAYRPVDGGELP